MSKIKKGGLDQYGTRNTLVLIFATNRLKKCGNERVNWFLRYGFPERTDSRTHSRMDKLEYSIPPVPFVNSAGGTKIPRYYSNGIMSIHWKNCVYCALQYNCNLCGQITALSPMAMLGSAACIYVCNGNHTVPTYWGILRYIVVRYFLITCISNRTVDFVALSRNLIIARRSCGWAFFDVRARALIGVANRSINQSVIDAWKPVLFSFGLICDVFLLSMSLIQGWKKFLGF